MNNVRLLEVWPWEVNWSIECGALMNAFNVFIKEDSEKLPGPFHLEGTEKDWQNIHKRDF